MPRLHVCAENPAGVQGSPLTGWGGFRPGRERQNRTEQPTNTSVTSQSSGSIQKAQETDPPAGRICTICRPQLRSLHRHVPDTEAFMHRERFGEGASQETILNRASCDAAGRWNNPVLLRLSLKCSDSPRRGRVCWGERGAQSSAHSAQEQRGRAPRQQAAGRAPRVTVLPAKRRKPPTSASTKSSQSLPTAFPSAGAFIIFIHFK